MASLFYETQHCSEQYSAERYKHCPGQHWVNFGIKSSVGDNVKSKTKAQDSAQGTAFIHSIFSEVNFWLYDNININFEICTL